MAAPTPAPVRRGVQDTGARPSSNPATSGNPATSSSFTTAMLTELLNDTLDPGYRAVAAARTAAARTPAAARITRSWWEGPIAWCGCLVIGFVLIIAYQQSHRSAPAQAAARKDLVSRIRSVESTNDQLDKQAKDLAAEVSRLRDSQLPGSADAAVRSLDVASGSVAVTGPGLTVSVADPAQPSAPGPTAGERPGTTAQNAVATLDDRAIRAIVSSLWSAGAEAVAVNGIRLTPNSSIRFASETILVDFQPINSPYSIQAIGNGDAMLVGFADSAEARALSTMKAVESISFSFATQHKLSLPAGVLLTPQHAQLGAAALPSGSPR